MEQHFQVLDKKSVGHQDWTPIVINTKKTMNEGMKASNKLSESQQREHKLLKQVDDDELTHKKVSPELRKRIQQGRSALKWKQKDLAQKVNLSVSIINDIETGKAIYNHQHMNKIKRALKI